MNLLSKIASFGAEKAHAAYQWDTLFTPAFSLGAGKTIWDVLNTVLDWVLMAAGFIAVLYLIIAGITYITAGGNPDQAKKGQQGVINAVIGIVIIVAAYFIINVAIRLAESV